VVLPDLIGPLVLPSQQIKELTGDFLAEYRVQRIDVELSPAEASAIRRPAPSIASLWSITGSRWAPRWLAAIPADELELPEGRAPFRRIAAERLAVAAPAKLELLSDLLHRHSGDRVIVFTYDNATAYQIARRFLVPAITHQTKTRNGSECSSASTAANTPSWSPPGALRGVDVPAANVASFCPAPAASANTSSASADCCASMARSKALSVRGRRPRHRRGIHQRAPPAAPRVIIPLAG